jgi:hypothetical protein
MRIRVRNIDPVLSQANGQRYQLYSTVLYRYSTVHYSKTLSMKVKFYILLIYCNEKNFFGMISFLRHSRTGKNCAHIEIQKFLKFWDTLLKTIIVKALKIFILYFTKNIFVKTNIRPDIRPNIRYPALIGYPVSGFWISRISGWPDIRKKQYPVHP